MAKVTQMHPGAVTPAKFSVLLKANTVFTKGDIVCIDATGYAVSGSATTGLIAVGRAEEDVSNTGGANGAKSIEVLRGVFKYANTGLTQAHLMQSVAYIDGARAFTATTTGRSIGGKVYGVDSDGVWIGLGSV